MCVFCDILLFLVLLDFAIFWRWIEALLKLNFRVFYGINGLFKDYFTRESAMQKFSLIEIMYFFWDFVRLSLFSEVKSRPVSSRIFMLSLRSYRNNQSAESPLTFATMERHLALSSASLLTSSKMLHHVFSLSSSINVRLCLILALFSPITAERQSFSSRSSQGVSKQAKLPLSYRCHYHSLRSSHLQNLHTLSYLRQRYF